MVDNQSNTYTPLEGRRPIDSPEAGNLPPRDDNMCVYIGLVMAGIGFVLPYNSFIIASDFWQLRFPGRSVALDMSMTYIIVAFATVLLNNVFLSLFSFKVRIMFGYMISLSTFLFISICEVAVEMFSMQTAYAINLVAISLTAIGCTVQQSSFYGFASMFPKQYTQAVMLGESVAGVAVAVTRICTKLVIKDDRIGTFLFLLLTVSYISVSYVFHTMSVNLPFVLYYTKQCSMIVLRPDEDRSDGELSTTKYGVLSLDGDATGGSSALTSQLPPATQIITPTATAGMSFSNPVYELSNPSAGESTLDDLNETTAGSEAAAVKAAAVVYRGSEQRQHQPNVVYKVEHILTPGACTASRFGDFKTGLESRWRVAHAIYPYMVSIALAYCVTLSLYPGIETEIISCNLKSWMPVLLMFTFNFTDLIGKMIALMPYNWTRRQLILLSGMRTGLIPLLLLCCAPRAQPVIAGEAAAFVFSAALGITNGMAGSLPMMLAPAKVPASLKEVTGNMMTLSYNVGLTAGSLIGYVFESMLGPQLINPCPSYPYIPMPPTTSTTAAATAAAAAAAVATTPATIGNLSSLAATAFGSGVTTISAMASTKLYALLATTTQAATAATSTASTATTQAAVTALAAATPSANAVMTTLATVAATVATSTVASIGVASSPEATTMRQLASTVYNVTEFVVNTSLGSGA